MKTAIQKLRYKLGLFKKIDVQTAFELGRQTGIKQGASQAVKEMFERGEQRLNELVGKNV